MVTYAIGDLHGELALLRRLLDAIGPASSDTLIFLGDYMDRGEASIETALALIELQRQGTQCIFLRGNHDTAWREQWEGHAFTGPPSIPGARLVWEQSAGYVPAEIGHWLAQTRLWYGDDYAWYIHAAAVPGQPVSPPQTPAEVALWGHSAFLPSPYDWGKIVVFGHHEIFPALVMKNKVCLDTASYLCWLVRTSDPVGRRRLNILDPRSGRAVASPSGCAA